MSNRNTLLLLDDMMQAAQKIVMRKIKIFKIEGILELFCVYKI